MTIRNILQPKVWLSFSRGRDQKQKLRLSAAHNEWNHVGIALVAMEEGFFADEGLTDVELISFPGETGELLDREAVQAELLAEGVTDIAIDPRTAFILEAKDQGKPVCIVAARRKNHAFLLVAQKHIQSIRDLRGQTLDMGQKGGAGDVMMRQVLKDHGLEPDKDVRVSYSLAPMHDSVGSYRAFIEGKKGPAKLATPEIAERLAQDGYPVLLDLRKFYPSRHDRVTAANETFVREKPEQLKGFLKSMIRACNYVLDKQNAVRFKQIMVNAGFLTSEREQRSFETLFRSWHERVSRDLSLPAEGIGLIVEEQKKAGAISSSFTAEAVLSLDALKAAQKELGTTAYAQ